MFATANQVLGQLYMFEKGLLNDVDAIEINFKKNGSYYDPLHGMNWWSYYFEPLKMNSGQTINEKIATVAELSKAWYYRDRITRKEAAALVETYIHVKPDILDEVELFKNLYFKNSYIIGVHYRGTDKKTEAKRVPYQKVLKQIEVSIPENRDYKIFVATDEQAFLDIVSEAFPSKVLATAAVRSTSSTPVHHMSTNSFLKGKEALIDALLLSNTDLLIRTSSNLSLWATYFNESLPVVLLNVRNKKTKEPE